MKTFSSSRFAATVRTLCNTDRGHYVVYVVILAVLFATGAFNQPGF
jgi:hypothetical protein